MPKLVIDRNVSDNPFDFCVFEMTREKIIADVAHRVGTTVTMEQIESNGTEYSRLTVEGDEKQINAMIFFLTDMLLSGFVVNREEATEFMDTIGKYVCLDDGDTDQDAHARIKVAME